MNPALLALITNIEARQSLAADAPVGAFHADPVNHHRQIYRNRNAKLGIDFAVDVLDFPGTQAFDARVVRIAAGCNNELHKHAHESLFYIISGSAEVRIGDAALVLNPGGLAFVPRWVFHQSTNLSPTDELVILAITDFGLTKAVLVVIAEHGLGQPEVRARRLRQAHPACGGRRRCGRPRLIAPRSAPRAPMDSARAAAYSRAIPGEPRL